MDVFDLRKQLVDDYDDYDDYEVYEVYTRSFIKISDQRVNDKVESALSAGQLWAKPSRLPRSQIWMAPNGSLWMKCTQLAQLRISRKSPLGDLRG